MNFNKYITSIPKANRETVIAYLETPVEKREPFADFLKRVRIKKTQYYRVELIMRIKSDLEVEEAERVEREKEESRKLSIQEVQNSLMPSVDEGDVEGWWRRQRQELNKAIMESAKKGNAQSQKLAKQLAGELVEKSEVKIGLSAEEYFPIWEEARARTAELHREINRDRGLFAESALLPDKVRTDTGRE